jgi:glycosyltransferase involved in cell wall biosynthesis
MAVSRIAVVTPTYPPYRGGMGKVAQQDATQLSALGYDVSVYAPPPNTKAEEAHPSELKVLRPLLRYGHAAFIPSLISHVRKADLVVLHYPFFGGAEPVAFAGLRKRNIPLVIMYHMDVLGRGIVAPVAALHGLVVRNSILRRADRIAVTSFDYARSSDVRDMFLKDPSLFRELPPSVDTKLFAPGTPSADVVTRFGSGMPTVLFVGGLDRAHYFKGVPILLQAFSSKALAKARVIIVGSGDLRSGYEKLAADLHLGDRAVFAGNVSDAELADLHRLSDVFAFPSIDRSEAFGIAALEAASTGNPVVASDLDGLRTIVRNGDTGHLVRPGSVSALAARLADLLDDAGARERLGNRGRQMAIDEYSDAARRERWRRMIEGLA